MNILGLYAVFVTEHSARPEAGGIEPPENADLPAFELSRLFQRRIFRHENIGVAKLAIGKNRNRHERRAAALQRNVICQRKLPGIVLAREKFLMAGAVLLERHSSELEVFHFNPAVAQRFGAQVIARGERQYRYLMINHRKLLGMQ